MGSIVRGRFPAKEGFAEEAVPPDEGIRVEDEEDGVGAFFPDGPEEGNAGIVAGVERDDFAVMDGQIRQHHGRKTVFHDAEDLSVAAHAVLDAGEGLLGGEVVFVLAREVEIVGPLDAVEERFEVWPFGMEVDEGGVEDEVGRKAGDDGVERFGPGISDAGAAAEGAEVAFRDAACFVVFRRGQGEVAGEAVSVA